MSMMHSPDSTIWLAILGLTVVSVVSRNFFMLSDKPWPMPSWLRSMLQVAPLAALVAVIAPEVLVSHGHVLHTWRDPRWPAALVASLYYFQRRDILGTIVTGMLVFLPLRIGLGW